MVGEGNASLLTCKAPSIVSSTLPLLIIPKESEDEEIDEPGR